MEGTRIGGTMRSLGAIDHTFALDGFERFRCDLAHVTVAQNRTLLVEGWAGDEAERRACREAAVLIDGRVCDATRFVRRRRDDVSRAYASRAFDFAGFVIVIPPKTLETGRHELVLSIEGGRSALPPLAFEVTAPARLATPAVTSTRFSFRADVATRFGLGMPGIVRGAIHAQPQDAPQQLFAIVDECDAYPAQLDVTSASDAERSPGITPFVACFVTGRMALGTHTLRFAAVAGDEDTLHLSEAWPFDMAPLSIAQVAPRLARTHAPASIDWADALPAAEPATPGPRTFARGSIACVRGWAVDAVARDSAKAAYLRFENGAAFAMDMRGARADVARALAMPEAEYCGFTGSIATDALAIGRNVARCFVVAKDATVAYPTAATIAIDVVA